MENVENGNLFSKNDAITSSGVASKSNLQNLIKRTNEEIVTHSKNSLTNNLIRVYNIDRKWEHK